jgi:hypothetical protein
MTVKKAETRRGDERELLHAPEKTRTGKHNYWQLLEMKGELPTTKHWDGDMYDKTLDAAVEAEKKKGKKR